MISSPIEEIEEIEEIMISPPIEAVPSPAPPPALPAEPLFAGPSPSAAAEPPTPPVPAAPPVPSTPTAAPAPAAPPFALPVAPPVEPPLEDDFEDEFGFGPPASVTAAAVGDEAAAAAAGAPAAAEPPAEAVDWGEPAFGGGAVTDAFGGAGGDLSDFGCGVGPTSAPVMRLDPDAPELIPDTEMALSDVSSAVSVGLVTSDFSDIGSADLLSTGSSNGYGSNGSSVMMPPPSRISSAGGGSTGSASETSPLEGLSAEDSSVEGATESPPTDLQPAVPPEGSP